MEGWHLQACRHPLPLNPRIRFNDSTKPMPHNHQEPHARGSLRGHRPANLSSNMGTTKLTSCASPSILPSSYHPFCKACLLGRGSLLHRSVRSMPLLQVSAMRCVQCRSRHQQVVQARNCLHEGDVGSAKRKVVLLVYV